MAFNGSGSAPSTGNATSGGGNSGNQDGPLNKRLCTGKENNEAGLNNNRVSNVTSTTIDFLQWHTALSFPPLCSTTISIFISPNTLKLSS